MTRKRASAPAAASSRRATGPRPVSSLDEMRRHADEAIAVLKAVGSPNRLMLLCQLLDGERSVNELAEALGLAQSVVSQHLSLLRRDGVVAGRREGQSIRYAISDERVRALMGTLFELFCGRA